MTKTQMMKLVSGAGVVLFIFLFVGIVCFYPAATRADETKILEWEVNDHVSVFITNIPCPASYKNKYPHAAVAIDKQTQIAMKGCYGKYDENNLVIHWDGTEDTFANNAVVPGNAFLVNPNKPIVPKKQEIPKEKGIDI